MNEETTIKNREAHEAAEKLATYEWGFSTDIESVKAEFLPALGKVVPGFDPSWVRESWMFGAPYAQPIVTREYASHIPPRRGPLPGL